MYLTQISYNNFRCLEDRKIEFDKNMNIIYGKNGQGKTSLIESIYFLGTGKSFRTKKTKEISLTLKKKYKGSIERISRALQYF